MQGTTGAESQLFHGQSPYETPVVATHTAQWPEVKSHHHISPQGEREMGKLMVHQKKIAMLNIFYYGRRRKQTRAGLVYHCLHQEPRNCLRYLSNN